MLSGCFNRSCSPRRHYINCMVCIVINFWFAERLRPELLSKGGDEISSCSDCGIEQSQNISDSYPTVHVSI